MPHGNVRWTNGNIIANLLCYLLRGEKIVTTLAKHVSLGIFAKRFSHKQIMMLLHLEHDQMVVKIKIFKPFFSQTVHL